MFEFVHYLIICFNFRKINSIIKRRYFYIAEVEGEISFVDEAYQLIPSQKEDENGYEIEASEEIMYAMNNGKVVVILIFLV
ncbi:hypothetical protein Peur_018970 [Populus x canadensis]